MSAQRLSIIAIGLGLLALPASLAAQPAPTASADTQATDAKPAPAPPPAAATTPGAAGVGSELAARLATGAGDGSAVDREDRAALAKFYAERPEPVWVAATGLTPAGEAIAGELRRAGDWGLDAAAFRLPAIASGSELSPGARADAEIALGMAILKYARHARGGRAEPTTLSKNLDRRLPLLDPTQVIVAAAKAEKPEDFLRFLHPRHPQFEALRQQYLALKAAAPAAASAPAAAGGKKGKAAATSLPETPNVRKLLVNMEQWRWMPESLGDFYVWVNVPDFTLRVVKGGQVIHSERVVVGKRETPTPIFSQSMEQVIFHPNWGIPESIKKQDVLPSLIRGSTRIFTFYQLRIQRGGRDVDPATVDWSTADIRQFHVYQPPGENNVLGRVKFRFPNKHDVYMHDTPQKQLFNADVRAFSHGCMRVRNPQRLAELLLGEDQSWPATRVAAAIGPGGAHNNQVNLATKVPVHVTYFTAAVGDDGKLKLFADLYGHESRIALGMEGKAHLVPRDPAPVQAEAVGRLAETTSNDGMGKKDWSRRVLNNNFANY
jgi:murein L,D-transpeptidase YcbB/YkuD